MNITEKSLKELQHRVLVAVAAAAAERVSGIFDRETPRYSSPLLQAVKIAWEYAEGARIAPQRILKARNELSAVIPNIEREPHKEAVMSAGVTGLYALNAITDASALSTTSALLAALDAVVCAAADPNAAEDAETAWQEFILGVARSSQENSVNRLAFMNAKYPLRLE